MQHKGMIFAQRMRNYWKKVIKFLTGKAPTVELELLSVEIRERIPI
jgi:hypothetical protein